MPAPFNSSRYDRAAAYLQQSAPELALAAQFGQLADQSARDDMMSAQFVAQQQQQELANARVAAKDALDEQARQQTVGALGLLQHFDPMKPDADVELTGILAANPGASSDPVVREIFAKRMSEVGLNKQFADLYAANTGGMPIPTDEDGRWNFPLAKARLTKAQALTDATAKGLFAGETGQKDLETWKAAPESDFLNPDSGFGTYVAQKSADAGAVALAKTNRDAAVEQSHKIGKAVGELARANKLAPTDMLGKTPEDIAAATKKHDALLAAEEARITGAVKLADTPISLKPVTPADKAADIVKLAQKSVKEQFAAKQKLTPTQP